MKTGGHDAQYDKPAGRRRYVKLYALLGFRDALLCREWGADFLLREAGFVLPSDITRTSRFFTGITATSVITSLGTVSPNRRDM